jgi:hypothetical protein
MVDNGDITPIVKGVPIKGQSDQFSYSQVAALIMVGAMREFIGLHPDNYKSMLDDCIAAEPEEKIAADAAEFTAFRGPDEARPKKERPASKNGNVRRPATVQQLLISQVMTDAIDKRHHALLMHYRENVLNRDDHGGRKNGTGPKLFA